MLAEKIYLRIDDMCSEINEAVFESINDVQIELLKIYYQLKGIQDQKIEKRQVRKESRGKWVGGGFGVKGAIKGAVEASILNIASGAAHSTFNAIGNFGTKVNTNLKVDKFIDEYGYGAMIQCIENGLMLVYHECLHAKKMDSLYTELLLSKHANVLKHYQEDNDKFAGEQIFMNIKNNPYNIAQYEILIRRYGDKSKILEKIGMNCGLNIMDIKSRILKEQCAELSKNIDYQTLEYNYTFIQEKKEQLGYDGTFYLEAETEKSLYRELSKELKRILNQTNQEDRDSVLNAIETVEKIKNKFNYGEEVYEKLKSYLGDIEINERTVAGKIYDTKSKADDVRKYYVGNIKHATIKAATLSHKEKKIIEEMENKFINQNSFNIVEHLKLYEKTIDASLSSKYAQSYLEILQKQIVRNYEEINYALHNKENDFGKQTMYKVLGIVLIPITILGFFVGILPGIIALIIAANMFSRADEYKNSNQYTKDNKRVMREVSEIARINIKTGEIILKSIGKKVCKQETGGEIISETKNSIDNSLLPQKENVDISGEDNKKDAKNCLEILSVIDEKQYNEDIMPKGILKKDTEHLHKKGKKNIVIIVGVVVIVLAVLMVLGGSGTSTGTELSDYIPLAREDVIKFIEQNGMEEILESTMYGNDDLSITLNDNGNINMLIIDTPRYSLYGMKIGNEFTLEKNGRRLTEHNYGFLGEYGDRIVYGAVSDVDNSGGDRVIAITLDSAGVISKLEFMITDIQDILDAESEGAESEGIEIEDTESDITKSESVKSEYEPDTNNDTEEYFSAESSERYLTNEEISLMSDYEKLAVMYEIGARHGATFLNVEDGEEWQEYFNSKVWYIPSVPIELMEDDVLNAYEMSNIINISDSIMETLDTVNQGYMILPESNSRYYESYELSELTKEELRLARNEIYARHGRIFETEDLNQYFSSQPWYTGYLSADEFDDSVFNRYEKANLELIKSVEDEKASTGIATLAGSDVDWYLKYEEIETEVSSFYNNVSSQEEYTKKLMGEYQQWDKFLNEIYQYLKALYPDHRFEKIREDQRNWLKERDQAANQAIVDADGKYEDDAYYYVMISKTKERSQYLMDECLPVG